MESLLYSDPPCDHMRYSDLQCDHMRYSDPQCDHMLYSDPQCDHMLLMCAATHPSRVKAAPLTPCAFSTSHGLSVGKRNSHGDGCQCCDQVCAVSSFRCHFTARLQVIGQKVSSAGAMPCTPPSRRRRLQQGLVAAACV